MIKWSKIIEENKEGIMEGFLKGYVQAGETIWDHHVGITLHKEGHVRLTEPMNPDHVYKLEEENVIFLGFCQGWKPNYNLLSMMKENLNDHTKIIREWDEFRKECPQECETIREFMEDWHPGSLEYLDQIDRAKMFVNYYKYEVPIQIETTINIWKSLEAKVDSN